LYFIQPSQISNHYSFLKFKEEYTVLYLKLRNKVNIIMMKTKWDKYKYSSQWRCICD